MLKSFVLYVLLFFSFSSWSMNNQSNLENLPIEVVHKIIQFIESGLKCYFAADLSATNILFYHIVNNNLLWKLRCQKYDPLENNKEYKQDINYKDWFKNNPRIIWALTMGNPSRYYSEKFVENNYEKLQAQLIGEYETYIGNFASKVGLEKLNNYHAFVLAYFINVPYLIYKITKETSMNVVKEMSYNEDEALILYQKSDLYIIVEELRRYIDNNSIDCSSYYNENDNTIYINKIIANLVCSILPKDKDNEKEILTLIWKFIELYILGVYSSGLRIFDDGFNNIFLPLYQDASKKLLENPNIDNNEMIKKKKEIFIKLETNPYFSGIIKKYL